MLDNGMNMISVCAGNSPSFIPLPTRFDECHVVWSAHFTPNLFQLEEVHIEKEKNKHNENQIDIRHACSASSHSHIRKHMNAPKRTHRGRECNNSMKTKIIKSESNGVRHSCSLLDVFHSQIFSSELCLFILNGMEKRPILFVYQIMSPVSISNAIMRSIYEANRHAALCHRPTYE